MKLVHREILNSDAYQRSWKPNETNQHDVRNFSRAVPRRLPAEVAYDALVQATASDAVIVKMQIEMKGRAIALAGSNPRPGNLNNNGPNYALSVFGRSIRESNCDCDRSMEASLLQTVFLRNDQEVLRQIDRRDGWIAQVGKQLGVPVAATDNNPRSAAERQIAALDQRLKDLRKQNKDEEAQRVERRLATLKMQSESEAKSDDKTAKAGDRKPTDVAPLIEQAYLRTLSRYPTADEIARSQEHVASYDNPLDGVRGVLWALLNTKEFIVNH
jgi:hypothetical protein